MCLQHAGLAHKRVRRCVSSLPWSPFAAIQCRHFRSRVALRATAVSQAQQSSARTFKEDEFPSNIDYAYALPHEPDSLQVPSFATRVPLQHFREWHSHLQRQTRASQNTSTYVITNDYRVIGRQSPALWYETRPDPTKGLKHGDDVDACFSSHKPIGERAIELERAVSRALKCQDVHSLLAALVELTYVENSRFKSVFVEELPAPIFSEILRLLDPKLFITRWMSIMEDCRQEERSSTHLLPTNLFGHERFCLRLQAQIAGIVSARLVSNDLSMSDKQCLLRLMKETAHVEFAHQMWDSPRFNSVPLSLESYNYYLSTLAWSPLRNVEQKYTSVISAINEERDQKRADRLGIDGASKLKGCAAAVFDSMILAGTTGDEETFANLIVGLSKDGDLDGVDNLLKRVWDVDPHELTEDGLQHPKYSIDAPLRPTKRLLLAVVTAYGTNLRIDLAVRLVEYIARQNNLSIDIEVWEQLLLWAHIVTIKGNRDEIPTTAHIQSTMVSLWDIMVSRPYQVKPTSRMYFYIIKALYSTEQYIRAENYLRKARTSYDSERTALRYQQLSFARSTDLPEHIKAERIRYLTYAELKLQLEALRIKRYVRRLLKSYGMGSLRKDLPTFMARFVEDWAHWLPADFGYYVASGRIFFPLPGRMSLGNEKESAKQPRHLWQGGRSSWLFRKGRHIRYLGSKARQPVIPAERCEALQQIKFRSQLVFSDLEPSSPESPEEEADHRSSSSPRASTVRQRTGAFAVHTHSVETTKPASSSSSPPSLPPSPTINLTITDREDIYMRWLQEFKRTRYHRASYSKSWTSIMNQWDAIIEGDLVNAKQKMQKMDRDPWADL